MPDMGSTVANRVPSCHGASGGIFPPEPLFDPTLLELGDPGILKFPDLACHGRPGLDDSALNS
jgi:hypothetical protein